MYWLLMIECCQFFTTKTDKNFFLAIKTYKNVLLQIERTVIVDVCGETYFQKKKM